MDLETAIVCAVVCVVLAVIVYGILAVGVKEKTFEEAMEEQRRKERDLLLEPKGDKPKKEKKYKKVIKRSKEKTTPEEESRPVGVDFKTEAEIIPPDPDPETKPGKTKKKLKPNPPPKSILLNKNEGVPEIVPPIQVDDTEPPMPANGKVPKDEVERRLSLTPVEHKIFEEVVAARELLNSEESQVIKKREESKSPEKEKIQKEEANLVAQVPPPPAPVNSKKSKKTKQDIVELVDGDVSVKKLFSMLRNASLAGDELQMLIDVLLNKQQGEAAEWTKKNDPVVALKKQLQEKEQQLEEERRMVQSLSSKTKELRQELNQEKSRFNASERGTREKLQQQQQEITTLQGNVQRSRDQHQTELSVIQGKLQQMQQFKGEVNNLEKKISQLEAEKQSWLGLEIQLQREVEQLNSNLSSLELERESLAQQALHQQVQAQELKEAEHRNASLAQELQRAKNTCNTLEGEKGAFQKRLEAHEQQHRKVEDDAHKLKCALRESQSKQQESEHQAEQHLNLVKNLENKNNDLLQQVQDLKSQAESLVSQLQEASARSTPEASPVHQQNGDLAREEEERKLKDLEHSKM